MVVVKLKKVLITLFIILINLSKVIAEEARMDFVINVPEYLQIQTITSPVLTANITDDTGNLYTTLSSRFRVISNARETKTLYLNAKAITENGYEDSLFNYGSRVYVAFANVAKKPTSQSLANCKLASRPQESPGVVAYPINSILGAKSMYLPAKQRYEVYVDNGKTDITVNIGSNVLKKSFASNDPKGFYQATLFLTESEL